MSHELPPDQRINGMDIKDVWCWALSWFLKPPANPDKRGKQAVLVQTIKLELKNIKDVPSLHERYASESPRCLIIAREIFPNEWTTLSAHTTAAAYGLRFVELMTRREINATKPLPRWVGEWAIW